MKEYKICYICDERNEVEALECKSCGMDLSIINPTAVEEESAEECLEERIVNKVNEDISVKAENLRGKTMLLQEVKLVSRKDGFEILLPIEGGIIGRENLGEEYLSNCKYVSSSHANIYLREEQYFITDGNSTNGTKVNDVRLVRGREVKLNPEDKVTLANMEFLFAC